VLWVCLSDTTSQCNSARTAVVLGCEYLQRWCSAGTATSISRNSRVSTRGGPRADPWRRTPPPQHCTCRNTSPLSVISQGLPKPHHNQIVSTGAMGYRSLDKGVSFMTITSSA
jgi:hypothetical protein